MRERWRGMSRLGRAVLTFTAVGAGSLVLLVAAFLWLPAVGSPSGDALQYSLTRNAGGSLLLGGTYECEEQASGTQICKVQEASNR